MLHFVATGGYSLEAYDKFKRIVRDARRHLAADAIPSTRTGTG